LFVGAAAIETARLEQAHKLWIASVADSPRRLSLLLNRLRGRNR
jgi:hypothetical protein